MMQTQFESMDEDIGGRKEKDARTRRDGPKQLLALSRPPHGTRSVPEVQRLSFRRSCGDLDDGGAPSSSLAHGISGPLGSHCTTATHAARSAIRSGCKSFHSSKEAAAPRSVPTIARCFGRTGGAFCSRRRSWMRIGTACANGGPRGAVPTRDWRADELAKQPQGRQDFVSDSDLEHDGRAPGESRVLDADLIAISEMRSRTACHDELTCAAALFSGSKL